MTDTERDKEIFDIVRESYRGANTDYLKSQVRTALERPTMTKEETIDGLLDWVVIGGCTGPNEYYRNYILNAISHLM